MTIQDITIISTILFMLITIAFSIRYCSILRLAQQEYVKAKSIVGEIVISFKKRQDKQNKNIEQLKIQVENTQLSIEGSANCFHRVESQVKDMVLFVKPQYSKNEELATSVDIIKKEIGALTETQKKDENHLLLFSSNLDSLAKS